MELIAAILLAGPLGFIARTPRSGLLLYLVIWTVIFPVQTAVVFDEALDGAGAWQYPLFNAVILAAGIGLNRFGFRLGQQRRMRRALVH